MKFLKYLAIAIITLVVIYVVLALIGPSNYKVSKEIKIGAPIDVVFNQTSVFANWAAFSAWAKADPGAVYTIENDNQTVGASMGWEGEISGKGSMTTTEIIPNEKFIYDLSFVEPFEMTSHGGFLYQQDGDSVLVTWYDEGEFGFMMRPMMLFMDVEAEIGPMFEQGLEGIKKICEAMETKPSIEVTEETVESKSMLFISESSSLIPDTMSAKMGAAYGEMMALISVAGLEMSSAPIAITKKFSLEEMMCEFDAALIVADIPEGLGLSGRIQKGDTYAGKALKTVHVGSYMTLKSTYDAFLAYIEANGYEVNGNSWEEYVDDPTTVAEAERRTFIYFPVK